MHDTRMMLKIMDNNSSNLCFIGQAIRCFGLVMIMFLLAACGGSGSSSSTNTGITYSGKTTAATLTTNNSGKLAAEVQDSQGTVNDAVFALKPSETAPAYNYIDSLLSTVESAIPRPQARANAQKLINLDPPITIDGSCGGSATATGSIDDASFVFKITMVFEAYCDNSATLSGSITISGSMPSGNSVLISSMSMTNLSIIDANNSFSLNGTISVTVRSSSQSNMTLNLIVRDNLADETVKLKDFVIVGSSITGGESVEIEGRVYHPEEGYVDVTTTTALFYASGEVYPSSGIILFTGRDNGRARLTAISSTQFQLELDADNDGIYESGTTGLWSELEDVSF